MYAATITKPSGGQNCNIFWPFDEEEDDLGLTSASANASDDTASRRHHVLNGQTAFTFYSFVLGFAVPLALILVFYILVIFKLKTVGPKNRSKEKKKSHRKVTRLVLTVITVYILCWLPYWITQLALIFTPPGHSQDNVMVAVMLLAGCLSYSNSAMNPVLYAFLSENFKKSFLKACTCATGRDANAALQVENSVFPRRRTLGASARDHNHHRGSRDANAGRGSNAGLIQVAGPSGGSGNGSAMRPRHHRHAADDSAMDERLELNDISTGVTTMTTSGRSSRVYEASCHSQAVGSEASAAVPAPPVTLRTTTFNGSLAPPQPQRV
jgi:hypothetical protein